jgi:RNA polymerase sigma-70 factor (ECF subfamily)
VQQSFCKAFLHLDTFEGKSSFSTWLIRIAINEALMCLRKNRTLSRVSLESVKSERETVLATEMVDPAESPAEIYEQHEQQKILSRAINQLNSEFRTALSLRLEDRSVEETAKILGVGIGTLKARLFRARQQLRMLLTPGPEFRRDRAIHKTRKRRDLDVNSHLRITAITCE